MMVLKEIVLRRGSKVLLNRASMTVHPGEKIGLIGRNGVGKSSLFALLRGELHEDAGEYLRPAAWQIAQAAQDLPDTTLGATEFVLAGDERLQRARHALAVAESLGLGEAMGSAHAAYADAGGHDARPRAQALLLGLGFDTDTLDRPVNSFSGGWRMRLQLAQALMCPADVLLLDEPTNHLDLDALVWLENWLQKFPGAILVISHDREFLDAVTQTTWCLDHGQLTRYGGHYSAYETLRAEQISQQQAAYDKQQQRIAHLQGFIDRFKAKASKAKQAQSRLKALARMEKLVPLLTNADFSFEFPTPLSMPSPMLTWRNAVMGYSGSAVLRGVRGTVLAGQRIGILGANGQGKSTLIKTLARVLPLLQGELIEAKGLKIGYFAQQELDVLRAEENALQHLLRVSAQVSPATREQELRNFLGRFLFDGALAQQPVGQMSGGEKARLVFALLVWQRPHLLLLDEPTNHLDLTMRAALSVALNEFEGAVLLVSHDRALLREVCDEFWWVRQGEVHSFDGDIEDYQRQLLDESRRRQAERKTPVAVTRVAVRSGAVASPQRQMKAWQKALAAVEQPMQALQAERSALEAALLQTYDPQRLADMGKKLQAVSEALDALETRWLELTQQIEQGGIK